MKKMALLTVFIISQALAASDVARIAVIYESIKPKIFQWVYDDLTHLIHRSKEMANDALIDRATESTIGEVIGDVLSLCKFLQGDDAKIFMGSVKELSFPAKEELMRMISDTIKVAAGGDNIWMGRRNYFAALIGTGVNIDFEYDSRGHNSFLDDALLYDDLEAATFALACGANAAKKHKDFGYRLSLARSPNMVKLLLAHKAHAPFRDTSREHVEILGPATHRSHKFEILPLFKDHGFDLGARTSNNRTLLHFLCLHASDYQEPGDFARKFKFLVDAGADWRVRGGLCDRTCLDIINDELTTRRFVGEGRPYKQTLLKAKELIERLEAHT